MESASRARNTARFRLGAGDGDLLTNNHSILWAIIHGILGWLYVIYVALFG